MKTKFEKPKMSELTSRAFTNFRADQKDDTATITGTPIVFDTPTDIGGLFEETIARGAISDEVLKDVAFFYNHDLGSKPIARTRTGKLKLAVDEKGVNMSAEVNLKRGDVSDLYEAIKDGDIDGMSFMFRVEGEEWRDLDSEYPKRQITKVGYVQEVSAVNYPAYESTGIQARTNREVDTNRQALDNARAEVVDTARILALEKLKTKYL